MVTGMSEQKHLKHVGLFFSNFHGGGIQRVMLTLANSLLQQGLRVDLIVVEANGALITEIPEACHLFDLHAGHASWSLSKLVTYLKNEEPDVVLSSQTHLNVVAVIARNISGRKVRLLLSEHVTIDLAAQHPRNWKDRFSPFLASVFYRQADEIILVSKETAKHFITATHLPEKKVKVIYNPIVSQKLIDQSRYYPDHAWFRLLDTPVLLAAGRLTPQKDFGTLLRAFSMVQAHMPSAKLIILGEGEEQPQLEQLSKELGVQEGVQFPGFMINPFAYMSRAAVFVLSSRWEGFANVLVEAMACGTPVVSTDCPSGPSEILENGKYGRLVPVGDPAALAEAILAEIKSPHDNDLLLQRAADFSIEKILPKYLESFFPDADSAL
jgi:glycosyltransferase involved in cell wall biosynthesis